MFQRNRQWNRQWQSVVAALSKSLKRLRQRNNLKAGLSTYMGDSGSILASPGCPLGPQQPPNRRPHARRDGWEGPCQISRPTAATSAAPTARFPSGLCLFYAFGLCVWIFRCGVSGAILVCPPPSPVVVKDCNPVGMVDRLSGASEIYVVES